MYTQCASVSICQGDANILLEIYITLMHTYVNKRCLIQQRLEILSAYYDIDKYFRNLLTK